jgi:hypothetical protein
VPATRSCRPGSRTSQPESLRRAPANLKPMVQPQRAALSAEPALQIRVTHGDSDWMQGQGPRGLITLGRIMPKSQRFKLLSGCSIRVARSFHSSYLVPVNGGRTAGRSEVAYSHPRCGHHCTRRPVAVLPQPTSTNKTKPVVKRAKSAKGHQKKA